MLSFLCPVLSARPLASAGQVVKNPEMQQGQEPQEVPTQARKMQAAGLHDTAGQRALKHTAVSSPTPDQVGRKALPAPAFVQNTRSTTSEAQVADSPPRATHFFFRHEKQKHARSANSGPMHPLLRTPVRRKESGAALALPSSPNWSQGLKNQLPI